VTCLQKNYSAACNQLLLDLEGHELHLMVQLNNGDSAKMWGKNPQYPWTLVVESFYSCVVKM
jgi:hypothetical protein